MVGDLEMKQVDGLEESVTNTAEQYFRRREKVKSEIKKNFRKQTHVLFNMVDCTDRLSSLYPPPCKRVLKVLFTVNREQQQKRCLNRRMELREQREDSKGFGEKRMCL